MESATGPVIFTRNLRTILMMQRDGRMGHAPSPALCGAVAHTLIAVSVAFAPGGC